MVFMVSAYGLYGQRMHMVSTYGLHTFDVYLATYHSIYCAQIFANYLL